MPEESSSNINDEHQDEGSSKSPTSQNFETEELSPIIIPSLSIATEEIVEDLIEALPMNPNTPEESSSNVNDEHQDEGSSTRAR